MDIRRYGNTGKINRKTVLSFTTLIICANVTSDKRCGLSFDGLFPLDWSTSEGNHHNQAGQSRVTLNLTAAAPVLIGYPDHHANSGASAETTVRKVSKLNGQTDDVSNVLASYHFW